MTRRIPLTDRGATDIRVDGDSDLVRHWIEDTAHVAGGPAAAQPWAAWWFVAVEHPPIDGPRSRSYGA